MCLCIWSRFFQNNNNKKNQRRTTGFCCFFQLSIVSWSFDLFKESSSLVDGWGSPWPSRYPSTVLQKSRRDRYDDQGKGEGLLGFFRWIIGLFRCIRITLRKWTFSCTIRRDILFRWGVIQSNDIWWCTGITTSCLNQCQSQMTSIANQHEIYRCLGCLLLLLLLSFDDLNTWLQFFTEVWTIVGWTLKDRLEECCLWMIGREEERTLMMNTRNWDSSCAPNRTERSVARSTLIFGNIGEFKITRKDLSSRITINRENPWHSPLIHRLGLYSIAHVIDPNHRVHDFHWFSIFHNHVRQIAVAQHCTWIIFLPSEEFGGEIRREKRSILLEI